jgi:hypothetical protein
MRKTEAQYLSMPTQVAEMRRNGPHEGPISPFYMAPP